MRKYITDYETEVSLAGPPGPKGEPAIVIGVVPEENGGTGLTHLPERIVDLGSNALTHILSDDPLGVQGALGVHNGGTGATTPAEALANLGARRIMVLDTPPETYDSGVIYYIKSSKQVVVDEVVFGGAVSSVNGQTGVVQIGAQQVGAIPMTWVGQPRGIPVLDDQGMVPSDMLPNGSSAIVPYSTKDDFPTEGSATILYLDESDGLLYRWVSTDVGYVATIGADGTASKAWEADRLTNARQLQIDLANTESEAFNGTANVLNIGVSNVLGVANGGTGRSTPAPAPTTDLAVEGAGGVANVLGTTHGGTGTSEALYGLLKAMGGAFMEAEAGVDYLTGVNITAVERLAALPTTPNSTTLYFTDSGIFYGDTPLSSGGMIPVPNGANLNAYLSKGEYFNSGGSASGISNRPASTSFVMAVLPFGADGSTSIQVFYSLGANASTTGSVYVRNVRTTGGSPWVSMGGGGGTALITQAEIDSGTSTEPRTVSPKLLADNFQRYFNIEAGTDLNLLIKPGVYSCEDETASSVLNKPPNVANNFSVIVEPAGESAGYDYVVQLFVNAGDASIYHRRVAGTYGPIFDWTLLSAPPTMTATEIRSGSSTSPRVVTPNLLATELVRMPVLLNSSSDIDQLPRSGEYFTAGDPPGGQWPNIYGINGTNVELSYYSGNGGRGRQCVWDDNGTMCYRVNSGSGWSTWQMVMMQ